MLVKLNQIANVDKFQEYVREGLISERVHPDDSNLRVYSYTKKAQFGGLWFPEVKIARGLILRVENEDFSGAEIVSRGFSKFFTVEQTVDGDWGKTKLVDDDEGIVVQDSVEIPFDAPAIVADKLDGALGVGYLDSSGVFQVATKGSFVSEEATVGNKVLSELDFSVAEVISGSEFCETLTPLFEIISPIGGHPIDYGDFEGLVYLGYVNNLTGEWVPADDEHLFAELGFQIAEVQSYTTLREALVAPYVENTEGFVVTVIGGGTEGIFKIKTPEYLELRKLHYGLRSGAVRDYLNTDDFVKDVIHFDRNQGIDFSKLVSPGVLSSERAKAKVSEFEQAVYSQIVLPALVAFDGATVVARGLLDEHGFTAKGEVGRYLALSGEPQEKIGGFVQAADFLLTGSERAQFGFYKSAVKSLLKEFSY